MPTFIMLINYTEKGIREIGDSPERAKVFLEDARKAGVTIKDQYWTMGGYDGVAILEAADEKKVTSLLLTLGSAGNIRTQTLQAFSREEMAEILAGST